MVAMVISLELPSSALTPGCLLRDMFCSGLENMSEEQHDDQSDSGHCAQNVGILLSEPLGVKSLNIDIVIRTRIFFISVIQVVGGQITSLKDRSLLHLIRLLMCHQPLTFPLPGALFLIL